MHHRSVTLISLSLLALAGSPAAQTVPTGFVVDTLSTTLATPNDCCFLPDGRVLVANSAGTVSLWAGAAVTIGTVPNVESGGERGLLSIAADPAFAQNGHFYVYYSSTVDSFMHLDRFTCTGDLGNPASTNLAFVGTSRRAILGALPDNAGNHNGGSVRFGPDGMLYLTVGDDANACAAQSLTSQVGCLLRLDVGNLGPAAGSTLPTFASLDPGTNPRSGTNDFSRLLLAHGLRNPFRMEIDQATGNLYIGDVGAGSEEEYSEYVWPAGALPLVNFGWPWREGMVAGSGCGGAQPAGLVNPIASVARPFGWASVMGGARYRNQGLPFDFGSAYEGDCFFLDYFAGEVRRLVQTNGVWGAAPAVPGQPNPTTWATGFNSVTSLRMGPDGALYFTQHGASLKRVRSLGPTNSVVAVGGGGQVASVGDPFPNPIVVQVLDTQGAPLPGGIVNFTLTGPGQLSTANPVVANAQGFAQTTVATSVASGQVTVTASTPNSPTAATFRLFARKLTATPAGQFLVLSIQNSTTAVPAQVPYIVLLALPGSPNLPTPFGTLCIDPGYALAFVVEDSTGVFGNVSLSGTGAIGAPSLTKLYTLPPGVFTGLQLRFQALGLDAVTGWFRTNCEVRQF